MLTDRQQFKVGFLRQCARAGLDITETEQLVKQGIAVLTGSREKQALDPMDLAVSTGKNILGVGAGTVGNLAKWLIPLSLIVPPVVGGAGAYAAARLSDVNDEDVTDVKLQEKIDAYRRATEIAKARAQQQRRIPSSRSRGRALL